MEISEELYDFYWGSRSLTEENFGYCSSYSRQEIFLSFFYLCNLVGAASLDFSAVKTIPFFFGDLTSLEIFTYLFSAIVEDS